MGNSQFGGLSRTDSSNNILICNGIENEIGHCWLNAALQFISMISETYNNKDAILYNVPFIKNKKISLRELEKLVREVCPIKKELNGGFENEFIMPAIAEINKKIPKLIGNIASELTFNKLMSYKYINIIKQELLNFNTLDNLLNSKYIIVNANDDAIMEKIINNKIYDLQFIKDTHYQLIHYHFYPVSLTLGHYIYKNNKLLNGHATSIKFCNNYYTHINDTIINELHPIVIHELLTGKFINLPMHSAYKEYNFSYISGILYKKMSSNNMITMHFNKFSNIKNIIYTKPSYPQLSPKPTQSPKPAPPQVPPKPTLPQNITFTCNKNNYTVTNNIISSIVQFIGAINEIHNNKHLKIFSSCDLSNYQKVSFSELEFANCDNNILKNSINDYILNIINTINYNNIAKIDIINNNYYNNNGNYIFTKGNKFHNTIIANNYQPISVISHNKGNDKVIFSTIRFCDGDYKFVTTAKKIDVLPISIDDIINDDEIVVLFILYSNIPIKTSFNIAIYNAKEKNLESLPALSGYNNYSIYDFSLNAITTIENNKFTGPCEKISFNGNSVNTINNLIFTDISEIDFSFNVIKEINSTIAINNCNNLNFSYNYIEKCNLINVFAKNIDLSKNAIVDVDAIIVNNYTKLIDLSTNEIVNFANFKFNNLAVLSISNNKIESLPNEIESNYLQELLIDENAIKSGICEIKCPMLKKISIKNNTRSIVYFKIIIHNDCTFDFTGSTIENLFIYYKNKMPKVIGCDHAKIEKIQ